MAAQRSVCWRHGFSPPSRGCGLFRGRRHWFLCWQPSCYTSALYSYCFGSRECPPVAVAWKICLMPSRKHEGRQAWQPQGKNQQASFKVLEAKRPHEVSAELMQLELLVRASEKKKNSQPWFSFYVRNPISFLPVSRGEHL